MNTLILPRRRLLQTGLALGAACLLPAARACEFFTTNLRVTHPWTRATGGEDFAIVCMKFDEVTITDRLIRVETPVATRAELAGVGGLRPLKFLIPKGRETLLSETGTFVRLSGLQHPLEVARSYPLTLVFEKGGVVSADLSVDYERLG